MKLKKRNVFISLCVIMISLLLPTWVMAAEDGQNPVMNFAGNYVCDRAQIEVMPKGEDIAVITAFWSNSAFERVEWSMSGVFDTDTLSVSYSDCTMKTVAYDGETGETDPAREETVEYTDGTGSFIFGEDGTVFWSDDQDHIADGMVFEYISEAEKALSFTSEMTEHVRYTMYVGTNDKDSYEPVLPFDEARELANNICAKYVSGYTQVDAKGGWLDDAGVLTQEDTLIYIFFDASEEQIQKIMDELIDALHQSSVLVEKQEIQYSFYDGE